ncbi:taste receptor type 2 member 16 [Cavia porcellus]|uniref:Taste receptor type 2 n=1 Tax=Cavia porcellus TaxID=10141 RepID=H0VA26_CAVPO|nr:taste receptor type 2 member 16 [Cavia porcellus]
MVLRRLGIFFIIIYVFESLTVMAQSSFTVAVLGRKWVQVKRLSPVEMTLTSLSICRFFLQWTSMLNNFCFYFHPDCVLWHTGTIWEFTNILTFWLTSLLAVLYCVKISCIAHPIFLWLRWRISRLVPWLLLGALVISCAAVIPRAIRNHIFLQLAPLTHVPTNNSLIERLNMLEPYVSGAQKMFLLTIPFLLFLICTVFLMASLIQHRKKMQKYNTGHSGSSQKAHSTALKSLAVFFVIFLTYFLSVIITYTGIVSKRGWWYWAWEAGMYALISVHSTSLMMSSPTLKKAIKVKCWA